MNPAVRKLVCAAAVLLLAACGKSSTDPAGPDLMKAQRDAMDKAKGTEQTVLDAAKKTDQQLESQSK